MKRLIIALIIGAGLSQFSCKEEIVYTPLQILTMNQWQPDSLLANGEESSGPGQILEKFNGEALFNEDGSGKFGDFNGTWYFSNEETDIVIASDSLAFPLTLDIVELTEASLKVKTIFPQLSDPLNPIYIRMTFLAE